MALKAAEHFSGDLTLFPKFAMVTISDLIVNKILQIVIPEGTLILQKARDQKAAGLIKNTECEISQLT